MRTKLISTSYFNTLIMANFCRVCVSSSLPEGVLVRLEVVVWRCDSGRSSMHVQSHSEWAPANIGPYSQSYTVSMQGLPTLVGPAISRGLEPPLLTTNLTTSRAIC